MAEFNGPALGAMAVGVIFVYGGLTNRSPLQAVQAIVQGQSPSVATQGKSVLPTIKAADSGVDTTSPGGITQASGTGGSGQVMAFFKAKKVPTHQIAGAMGNIQVESGFSSTAGNAAEGAIGFCQWEKGRRKALQAFAASRHTSETDPGTQLDFMWAELHGSEIGAYTLWRATTTPASAASVWDSAYERSDGSTRSDRIANANYWYQQLGGK